MQNDPRIIPPERREEITEQIRSVLSKSPLGHYLEAPVRALLDHASAQQERIAELARDNVRLENVLLTYHDVCKERKQEIAALTAERDQAKSDWCAAVHNLKDASARSASLEKQLACYADTIRVRWQEYGYKPDACPSDPLLAIDGLLQLIAGENDGARRQTVEFERRAERAEKQLVDARAALEDIVKVGENTHVWRHVRVAKEALAALSATPPAQQPTGRDWTGDRGHENGNYQCRCCICGEMFIGHKRRVTCKLCADAAQQEKPE